jgi:exodeoxyribonuclease VII large subunit
VSEFTRSVKAVLAGSFPIVRVLGEISGVRTAPTGIVYFTLKDDAAQLRCVLFRAAQQRVTVAPADGLACEVRGTVGVYDAQGVYQLQAEDIIPRGEGALRVAYEKLAARLLGEGVFAPERKRPLPPYPRTVGVVTSPTGAAVRDVIRILHQRMPNVRIVVIPVLVQGASAAPSIVRGLARANPLADIDVLIVGRGGGSIEDLWAFNEEPVVRAIAASRIPVISAVGHERDTTLADLAADARASTPSGAAQIAVRDARDVRADIAQRAERLRTAAQTCIHARRASLAHVRARYGFQRPRDLLLQRAQRVDEMSAAMLQHARRVLALARQRVESDERHVRSAGRESLRLSERAQAIDRGDRALRRAARAAVTDRRAHVTQAAQALRALGPENVLQRGYGILERAAGGVITRVADVHPPEILRITMADGSLTARAEATSPEPSPLVSGARGVENAGAQDTSDPGDGS